MLAIWNRKEVMLTNDMERLVKARYALQGAGIVYTLKTKNFSAVHHGGPAIAQNSRHQDVMYYLYVHKKDEDRALQKSMLVLAVMSVRSCRVRYCFNG